MKPWRTIRVEFEDGSNLFIERGEYEKAVKTLKIMEELNEAREVARKILKLEE